ncbi:beta-galactosidase [Hirschia litorea]|uniref:Beta-galactosidase n=1 Tax=Hirschia litorea TaxID=1199156 RepID=A0ABW2IQD7_9PROT
MSVQPSLGVCYFPEQRDESEWQNDIDLMVSMGLKKVRIAEFSWALLEPKEGGYEWGWLDRSIDLIGAAGLEVILCTPTATPPKWLIDKHPDILAVDANGQPRKFGSRRHYCFSSAIYREKMSGIVTAMAQRYGQNKYVTAWQADNEYGCHNTTRSYSKYAQKAFRVWLKDKYQTIDRLNAAWGNVFWSMLYASFEEVDLPNQTVTEPNPSHVLDFYRFSSDQVVSYNKQQVDILRAHSLGRDMIHNFMGFYHEFDHFKVGQDLDISAWDSYPTGFLDMFAFSDEEKARYFRQGHPDIAAFHHDLYRGCGNGRWAVIEQQPGPVNWARHNSVPLPGMVRLWTHEAIAHGAEFVTYFRWDQARFAQEQMHAGLLRPDNAPSPAYGEAQQAAEETASLPRAETTKAKIAFVFSYDALWLYEAHPQGAQWSYPDICFRWYSQLRLLGQDIDIVSSEMDLADYDLIVIPSLPVVDDALVEKLKATQAIVLMGPRTGSKTPSVQIPENLAPGKLQTLLPLKVTQSESLPPNVSETIAYKGGSFKAGVWLDYIDSDLTPLAVNALGAGVLYRNDNYLLLGTLPEADFLNQILRDLANEAKLPIVDMPVDLRMRHKGACTYVMNYGQAEIKLNENLAGAKSEYLVGTANVPSAGVSILGEQGQGNK